MSEFKEWQTEPAWIDDDVIEIDEHTWAIHGVVPVDGDVLLEEFATPEKAWAALDALNHVEPDAAPRHD